MEEDIWGELEKRHDPRTIQSLVLLFLPLRSALHHQFIGKIPKDVLDWIEQGKEFSWDENLRKTLNDLKLKLYSEVDPEKYWETSEKILEELKTDPTGLGEISLNDYKLRLLEELRKVIPKDRLVTPIGKGWTRERQKRKELSRKNWPLFRKAVIQIHELLYPETKSTPYNSKKARLIATLMRTELGLKDLTDKDIYSIMQQEFKKPERSPKLYSQLKEMILSGELKRDQKLDEKELSRIFNSNKIIVYRALMRLREEKLVAWDGKNFFPGPEKNERFKKDGLSISRERLAKFLPKSSGS